MGAEFYTLFSSSKGNSAFLRCGNDRILIDAGVSARSVGQALSCVGSSLSELSAIFITHEHSDHIKGLATITKKTDIPVFAPAACLPFLAERVADPSRLFPLASGRVVKVGGVAVCPVATPHDALGSVGFRILACGELIGYFTDIGHLSENVLRGLSGCSRVVIESNHDIFMLENGSYPYPLKRRILGSLGHLSNAECSRLLPHLAAHGTRSFILAHLSEENNRPAIAYESAEKALCSGGFGVLPEGDCRSEGVRLRIAPVSGICEL